VSAENPTFSFFVSCRRDISDWHYRYVGTRQKSGVKFAQAPVAYVCELLQFVSDWFTTVVMTVAFVALLLNEFSSVLSVSTFDSATETLTHLS